MLLCLLCLYLTFITEFKENSFPFFLANCSLILFLSLEKAAVLTRLYTAESNTHLTNHNNKHRYMLKGHPSKEFVVIINDSSLPKESFLWNLIKRNTQFYIEPLKILPKGQHKIFYQKGKVYECSLRERETQRVWFWDCSSNFCHSTPL